MSKMHFLMEKYTDDEIHISMHKYHIYNFSELDQIEETDGDIFVYYPFNNDIDFVLANGEVIDLIEENNKAKERVLKDEMPRSFSNPLKEAAYTNTLYSELTSAVSDMINDINKSAPTIRDEIIHPILSKIRAEYICHVSILEDGQEYIAENSTIEYIKALLASDVRDMDALEELSRYAFYTNNGYRIVINPGLKSDEINRVAKQFKGTDLGL